MVLMSPLQLGHVNSCLTLPSELSSKVLAGQLQVWILSMGPPPPETCMGFGE